MRSIALTNQKGGVGKSTTTFHLARAAVLDELRVLVIDLDPQGNITAALAPEFLDEQAPGLADALSARSTETLASVITSTIWDGCYLAPTTGEALSVVRDELVLAGAGREATLLAQLHEIRDDFDLVLIDCPPSLDQLTINALTCATGVLVVSQARQWSASGLARLAETIRAIQTYYNPALQPLGIVVNQFEHKTVSGMHWYSELSRAAEDLQLPLFEPPIPKRVVIGDAVEAATGLDEYPGVPRRLVDIYDTYLREVIK